MTNTMDTYFTIHKYNSTIIIELDYLIFLENESYSHKEKLKFALDEIEEDKTINVLVISNDHPNFSMKTYQEKWNSFYSGTHWESNILRVFRTYDELFLKIKSLRKAIIFMNNKAINSMLFNFSMLADLRCVSDDFVVENNNNNMLNIPKGGILFSNSNSAYRNPFKLLFLLTEIKADTLYKRQLIDRVYSDKLKSEVLKIADHLATFDYSELYTIKVLDYNKLNVMERKLQHENEFLLSCIRTKINK